MRSGPLSIAGTRSVVHESLKVPRLVSLPVQGMLPFRMPRRA